ncbi:MAG: type II secretion system F family protein [Candidatus Nanopelagicales bacterium]
MTPAQVLAGLAALVAVGGVVLMVLGLAGAPERRPRPANSAGRPGVRIDLGWHTARWPLAGLVGIGVWAVSGWPALGVGAGAAAIGLPAMAAGGRRAEITIDRVEAVEEWTRRLADVLAIGVGLEQAISTAARSAPEPISAEVATLAARIAARTPTETALRRFAEDLDDASADLVVAALILAARRRGPGVAGALTAIADSVGEEVAARRRIEADRAKPRTTARAVTTITLAIIAAGMLNRGYTGPYGTLLGQVVLATTLGFFAAALWWMHSMTLTTAPARVLASEVER